MTSQLKLFDNAIDEAREEHEARMRFIVQNAEKIKRGYIMEHGEISRRLMHEKIEALRSARSRGVMEEVVPNGDGKSQHQQARHSEHEVGEEAQQDHEAGATGREPEVEVVR